MTIQLFLLQVTEKQWKMVFEVCRGVINQDKFIALYLLPYLILQVLIEGSAEDQSMVITLSYPVLRYITLVECL